jgi:hypothetical protein
MWVDGNDEARQRLVRWSWKPAQSDPLPQEAEPFTLVPGEPAYPFRARLMLTPERVRWLNLFIRVFPGEQAGFRVTALQIGAPADQASPSARAFV